MNTALRDKLQEEYRITAAMRAELLFERSRIVYYQLDEDATARANGIAVERVEEVVHEIQKNDQGHVGNVRAAQKAAAAVAIACIE